ncbi:hypothetical protein XENTR_v10000296 [Xenopus tropicalis]|nr:hypothetical protein XENTR_v10000296 [Xenopus tropicalis]
MPMVCKIVLLWLEYARQLYVHTLPPVSSHLDYRWATQPQSHSVNLHGKCLGHTCMTIQVNGK